VEKGIIVDLAAIAAVTLLAVLGKLPESVTAAVVTMVVAGRFKPPSPTSPIKLPSVRPPVGPSGVLSVLAMLWHAAPHLWRK
jgi:hypothetical protein